MDRNKVVFLSVLFAFLSILAICATAVVIHKQKCEVEIISRPSNIKSKELEIGLYDQLTYCMKTVMKEARESGKPVELSQAEKACAKFNTTS